MALLYLQELCYSTLRYSGSLRSGQAGLPVPRSQTSIVQRHTFSVTVLAIRNGLSVSLHLMPTAIEAMFYVGSGLTGRGAI